MSQGKIEISADELQHGGLVPITVPLADPKQFGQKVKGAAQEMPSSRLKGVYDKGISLRFCKIHFQL